MSSLAVIYQKIVLVWYFLIWYTVEYAYSAFMWVNVLIFAMGLVWLYLPRGITLSLTAHLLSCCLLSWTLPCSVLSTDCTLVCVCVLSTLHEPRTTRFSVWSLLRYSIIYKCHMSKLELPFFLMGGWGGCYCVVLPFFRIKHLSSFLVLLSFFSFFFF